MVSSQPLRRRKEKTIYLELHLFPLLLLAEKTFAAAVLLRCRSSAKYSQVRNAGPASSGNPEPQ
jgi:hypothetical protein